MVKKVHGLRPQQMGDHQLQEGLAEGWELRYWQGVGQAMGLRCTLDVWLVSIMSRCHVRQMPKSLSLTTQHTGSVEEEHCGWK